MKKDFNFPGASDLSLTMSLRKDGEFSELNQIPLHRKVGEMVHIEAVLSSEEPIRLNRFSYGLKVLRCWETLTKDGVSLIYKNIVTDRYVARIYFKFLKLKTHQTPLVNVSILILQML